MNHGREVIFFDGECGLCNRLNLFVLKRDSNARFRFAPLQGSYARRKLTHLHEDPDTLDTFYVLIGEDTTNERVLKKSAAALSVVAHLPGRWKYLSLLRLVPLPLRDAIYDVIARNRHRFLEHVEACPVPQPEWRARFISEDDMVNSSSQNPQPVSFVKPSPDLGR